tara:strand:- start:1008 stop:2519 length:1512 start_codon:yes stop_codon:yes gene_type:complete
MATPITWQNVNAPSNDAAMRGIESAQKGILGGMDRLSSTWADGVKISEDVAARGRQASQEEYLNLVQSYKTPEELQAARMSGVLDQRLAALDPRNQAAVRGAQEARITSLQTQTTAGDTYAKGQKTTADAPMIERHAQMVANNDTVGAAALRAANPNVNWGNSAQDAYNAGRTRKNQNTADLLAAEVDPVELANAKATALLASEARAQATLQQKLTGTDLANQQRTGEEQVEDRKIAEITARFGTSSQQRTTAVRTGYGVLAKARGFNLAPDGGPDRSRMTEPQIAALTAAGKAAGMPAFDTLISGDTQSVAAFRASLKAQGFSDRGIANAGDLINSAGDTSSVGAPVGNDATRARLAQATMDVMQREEDAQNWYAPGSPNARSDYETLATDIEAMFKGTNMIEDLPDIQNLLNKAATTGIEVSTGVFLTPSKNDMMAAVRSEMGTDNFFADSRAGDIEDFLKKNMDTERVTKLQQQAAQSAIQNRDRDIRAELQKALFPPKK